MPDLPSFNRSRQWRALALRQAHAAGGQSGPPEGAAGFVAELPPPDAAAIARRLDAMADTPPPEIGDHAAYRDAVRTIRDHGTAAVGRLLASPEPLSPPDGMALEAVIFADGSRPTLLLADGLPPDDHPLTGRWGDEVSSRRLALQPIARAIGRIQPTGGGVLRYAGTGLLVAGQDGPRVLTNHHVIEEARNRFGVAMQRDGDRWTIPAGLEIDFAGEFGRAAVSRFQVVEARLPQGAASGFAGIDVAVLTLAPFADSGEPPAPAALSGLGRLLDPGIGSLCTIGYPGPPPQLAGVSNGIDWAKVVADLFGGADRFGLKRLAPGELHGALGANPNDGRKLAFGHDCTTLGGASGSPVIAWSEPGLPTFGLHFGGATADTNHAVAMTRIRTQLEALGVSFQP